MKYAVGGNMQAAQRFSTDIVDLLERTDEVQIEPRSPDGRRTKPVTIWVVVDAGEVYVRSYRGVNGRWYRALRQQPMGVLHVDGREIPFRAVHIDDPATIARVSEAFRRKYEGRWPQETADMLKDEVLGTTLRLEPVSS